MHSPDQVLTAAQMRAAEQAFIDRGTTVFELMERAGQAAADWIWRIAAGRSVTVLCGPGNNGGDGYVIAETLRARGLAVQVVAPLPPATDAAREARKRYIGGGSAGIDQARGGVLVDCLFGSGLSRPLEPAYEALLAGLAAVHERTVAVDVPSGVASDDGTLLGAVPESDLTLALGAWKPAHFLMPAAARMGALRLVEIGIEPVGGAASLYPRPRLAAPASDAHKYSRGLVGVVGGTMPGAAVLAAGAAARSGAGYVKLLGSGHGTPASLVVDDAPLARSLAEPRWSALLVGPGLGRVDEALDRLAETLEQRVPTVLDADALHMLNDDLLEGVDTSRILVTPHEGELAVMCRTFGVSGADKPSRALELAQTTGLTVLAKGPDTVLAAPTGRCAFFPRASSWLSVAGTGDVLAGIAAGRMAAGRNLFTAAGEAVWLHTEAAREAGVAFTADDLMQAIPAAYARLL